MGLLQTLAPRGTHPLVLVCAEETGVMPLLDDDVGDARLVILFQFDAGISDCQELIVKDLERQWACRVRGHTGTQPPLRELTRI